MKKLRPKDLLLLALALAGLAFAIPELAQRYIERRSNEIQGANIAASEAHAKILTTLLTREAERNAKGIIVG